MPVLVIANQKGGCGKTTTAINLAACLAECEKTILLIDLDPQAHSTLGFGIDSESLEKSLSDVLNEEPEKALKLEDVLVPISPRLDVAPSQILLSAFEQLWSGRPGREDILFEKIQPLAGFYDLMLVDCPPNIGLLTFNALRAADEILIPVEPSFFSLHGLKKLVETVGLVEETFSKKIPLRVLLTLWDPRTKLAQRVSKKLEGSFCGKVFNTYIRRNSRLQQAVEAGKPITVFDPHSAGYKDYQALARELLGLAPPPALSADGGSIHGADPTVFKEGGIKAGGGVTPEAISQALADELARETALMAEKAPEMAGTTQEVEGEVRPEISAPDETSSVQSLRGGEADPSPVIAKPPEAAEAICGLGTGSAISKSEIAVPAEKDQPAGNDNLEGVPPVKIAEGEEKESHSSTIDRIYEEVRSLPEEQAEGERLRPEEREASAEKEVLVQESSGGESLAEVLFSYFAPAARAVEIIGDFTDWQPVRLNPPPGPQGVWMKIVQLRKGIYQYKFLVDGRKTIDLQNSRFGTCPKGGIASIIEV